jgi:hypothetical protein
VRGPVPSLRTLLGIRSQQTKSRVIHSSWACRFNQSYLAFENYLSFSARTFCIHIIAYGCVWVHDKHATDFFLPSQVIRNPRTNSATSRQNAGSEDFDARSWATSNHTSCYLKIAAPNTNRLEDKQLAVLRIGKLASTNKMR